MQFLSAANFVVKLKYHVTQPAAASGFWVAECNFLLALSKEVPRMSNFSWMVNRNTQPACCIGVVHLVSQMTPFPLTLPFRCCFYRTRCVFASSARKKRRSHDSLDLEQANLHQKSLPHQRKQVQRQWPVQEEVPTWILDSNLMFVWYPSLYSIWESSRHFDSFLMP